MTDLAFDADLWDSLLSLDGHEHLLSSDESDDVTHVAQDLFDTFVGKDDDDASVGSLTSTTVSEGDSDEDTFVPEGEPTSSPEGDCPYQTR